MSVYRDNYVLCIHTIIWKDWIASNPKNVESKFFFPLFFQFIQKCHHVLSKIRRKIKHVVLFFRENWMNFLMLSTNDIISYLMVTTESDITY